MDTHDVEVDRQSSVLKKELRVIDLVGIQILMTIGYSWIGTAGKVGPAHIMLWLPAVLLFYIPSGMVVAHLSNAMPFEGGMYQWAKLRFDPMTGFLVAMNLWLYNVLICAGLGLQLMGTLPYVAGSSGAALATHKPAILVISLAIVCVLMLVAWRGLSLGKWVSTAGAFITVFVFGAVILVAIPHWLAGTAVTTPIAFSLPALTLLNLNLFGKMGFGALCGVDAVAVFAGEFRNQDVAGSIRKSVWLAAPVIAAMLILGTASVLTFSRPESIDLLMPPIQVLSLGAPQLANFASVLIVFMILSGGSLCFNVLSRFPMVAGWDHLLPAWFSRLHPRYATPVGSILFAGAVIVAFAAFANVGAGNQEAYQFLLNAAQICNACAYLVMFAIPLAERGATLSRTIRLAALSGFAMTLLFVALAFVPIVAEQNPGWFLLRMAAVVGALQGAGVLFYRRATRAR